MWPTQRCISEKLKKPTQPNNHILDFGHFVFDSRDHNIWCSCTQGFPKIYHMYGVPWLFEEKNPTIFVFDTRDRHFWCTCTQKYTTCMVFHDFFNPIQGRGGHNVPPLRALPTQPWEPYQPKILKLRHIRFWTFFRFFSRSFWQQRIYETSLGSRDIAMGIFLWRGWGGGIGYSSSWKVTLILTFHTFWCNKKPSFYYVCVVLCVSRP